MDQSCDEYCLASLNFVTKASSRVADISQEKGTTLTYNKMARPHMRQVEMGMKPWFGMTVLWKIIPGEETFVFHLQEDA